MRGEGSGRASVAGVIAITLSLVLLAGCHGDTGQGGGTDRGHAASNGTPQNLHEHVPTPPTADQIDPSSPQAVLHGTSTTQPGKVTSSPQPTTPPPAPH